MPLPVGAALVTAKHAHALEADPLVGADRALVGGCGVDRDAVMAALIEEPACEGADGVAAETPPVPGGAEEEIDARVTVIRVGLLGRLREPDQLALVLDGERDRRLGSGREERTQRLLAGTVPPAGDSASAASRASRPTSALVSGRSVTRSPRTTTSGRT